MAEISVAVCELRRTAILVTVAFYAIASEIWNDPRSSKRLGFQETPPASYGVQRDPPDVTFTTRRDREGGGGGCGGSASNPRWSYRCLRVSTYLTTSRSPPTNAPFPTLSFPRRWRRWRLKEARSSWSVFVFTIHAAMRGKTRRTVGSKSQMLLNRWANVWQVHSWRATVFY